LLDLSQTSSRPVSLPTAQDEMHNTRIYCYKHKRNSVFTRKCSQLIKRPYEQTYTYQMTTLWNKITDYLKAKHCQKNINTHERRRQWRHEPTKRRKQPKHRSSRSISVLYTAL